MSLENIYRVIGALMFISVFFITLVEAIALNVMIAIIRRNSYPTAQDKAWLPVVDKRIGYVAREALLTTTTGAFAALLWWVVNVLF